MNRSTERFQRVLALLLLGAFIAAIAMAVCVYPGGTWRNPDTTGFLFWENFWCDLLEPSSHNGADNALGRAFARVAFALFGCTLALFFRLEARGSSAAPWLQCIAGGCLASLLAVALTSSRSAPIGHAVAVIGGALTGLAGVALVLRTGTLGRPATALGWTTLGCASLAVGAYVLQGTGLLDAPWLAGVQKLASFFLCAFVALRLGSRAPDDR